MKQVLEFMAKVRWQEVISACKFWFVELVSAAIFFVWVFVQARQEIIHLLQR